VEASGRAGDQGGSMVGSCVIVSRPTASVCRQRRRSHRRAGELPCPSSLLAHSVSLPPKLGVTGAQTEHMPIYLRTFFRVLSSWVHHLMSVPGDA
jgi:hypothetical protein